jgi:hypothetical protein
MALQEVPDAIAQCCVVLAHFIDDLQALVSWPLDGRIESLLKAIVPPTSLCGNPMDRFHALQ